MGFRTDDDFGGFVADVEQRKENGEAFYMCHEGSLNDVLNKTYRRGFLKGLILGTISTVAVFCVVLFSWEKHGL